MPLTQTTGTKQLSDGNTQGTILGQSASDVIGFYGLTAGVSQPSGAAQAALPRGTALGMVATNATSQSPGGVTAQSTNEVTMTLGVTTNAATGASFALLSTDFLVVNKPTQQAGIGIGGIRFSGATQVAVQFGNLSSATVTATAGEKYGIVAIRGLPFVTQTVTPASVGAATTTEQIFTVTGARVGDAIAVLPPSATTNIVVASARVVSANRVGVTYGNTSPSTATTPASGTYTFFSTGGIDAAANVIDVQKNIGALTGPTSTNTSAQSITMTGLATSDVIAGVNKPTAQAGLLVGPGFVSGANALGMNFTNVGATVTPTTFEVYGVTVWRPAPVAPSVNYSQTLTPAAVPPNTTTSQTFTVTGLVASSMVFVNKPSIQPGLGVLGARVSGTNVLEITYANFTAATMTPTAETYTIVNMQQAVPDVGDTWIHGINPAATADTVLSNAIRAALVNTNFIAGA